MAPIQDAVCMCVCLAHHGRWPAVGAEPGAGQPWTPEAGLEPNRLFRLVVVRPRPLFPPSVERARADHRRGRSDGGRSDDDGLDARKAAVALHCFASSSTHTAAALVWRPNTFSQHQQARIYTAFGCDFGSQQGYNFFVDPSH